MQTSRLLLVDDEERVTQALKRTLRREPFEIFTANCAEAALDVLKKEAIEVVVSDCQMPGMDGCEFLSIVRKKYPGAIRMMLTGQNDTETAIKAINNGEVYRFFRKPCDPTELRVSLRQAVLKQQLLSQSQKLLEKYRETIATDDDTTQIERSLLRVERDSDGAVVIDSVDQEIESLLEEMGALLEN